MNKGLPMLFLKKPIADTLIFFVSGYRLDFDIHKKPKGGLGNETKIDLFCPLFVPVPFGDQSMGRG
jgi:hypothetical protein